MAVRRQPVVGQPAGHGRQEAGGGVRQDPGPGEDREPGVVRHHPGPPGPPLRPPADPPVARPAPEAPFRHAASPSQRPRKAAGWRRPRPASRRSPRWWWRSISASRSGRSSGVASRTPDPDGGNPPGGSRRIGQARMRLRTGMPDRRISSAGTPAESSRHAPARVPRKDTRRQRKSTGTGVGCPCYTRDYDCRLLQIAIPLHRNDLLMRWGTVLDGSAVQACGYRGCSGSHSDGLRWVRGRVLLHS